MIQDTHITKDLENIVKNDFGYDISFVKEQITLRVFSQRPNKNTNVFLRITKVGC